MPIRNYKPTSAGRRFQSVQTFDEITTVEYDPNRTARIALVTYADGDKRYILHPLGLKVGDAVMSGENCDILPGNCLPLKNIPLGTMIHNVELRQGKGGQTARSAGGAPP